MNKPGFNSGNSINSRTEANSDSNPPIAAEIEQHDIANQVVSAYTASVRQRATTNHAQQQQQQRLGALRS